MERFFRIIRRVNSILLLVVLLGVGGCAIWYGLALYHWYHPHDRAIAAAEEEDEPDPVSLTLGDAETVTGTDIQMLRLTTDDQYGRHQDQQTRNILFLSAGDHRGTWLFPTHDNLVLETDQIRPWRSDDFNAPTKALYVQFIPGDPEHAMGPSEYDPFTVALARSDGTGLVEVLRDVDEVLSYEQFDAESLSITYRNLEELRLARVSLDSFAKLSDDLVIAVPDQLSQ
jgi:hypothetical protein